MSERVTWDRPCYKCRSKLCDGTCVTATQPLAAPVQQEAEAVAKPFGWYGESRFDNDFTTNEDTSRRWHANGYRLTPLYATPPAHPVLAPVVREPLTDATRELIAAAQAVIERWDTPAWKDAPHTAIFINRMRAAIDRHFGIQATTGEQSHG